MWSGRAHRSLRDYVTMTRPSRPDIAGRGPDRPSAPVPPATGSLPAPSRSMWPGSDEWEWESEGPTQMSIVDLVDRYWRAPRRRREVRERAPPSSQMQKLAGPGEGHRIDVQCGRKLHRCRVAVETRGWQCDCRAITRRANISDQPRPPRMTEAPGYRTIVSRFAPPTASLAQRG
jgi:hypothetical protein